MLKHKPLFIFLVMITLLLPALMGQSQNQRTTRFTGDSTKFIGELNGLLFGLSENDQKLVQPVMAGFVQKWNQEAYNPATKKFIYFLCNEMLKKKIRIFPDFFNYIKALNVFMDSHQSESLFTPWSAILKQLISEKSSRNFNSFLEITTTLFGEGLMYKSQSVQWKVYPANYTIRLDSVPVIEFSKADLICHVNKDSMVIYGTRGVFFPLSLQWAGHEGRVDWHRVGIEPSQVSAELDCYQIQVRFSKVAADSVRLFNKKYFSSPIIGRLIDKVLVDVDEDKASYPRFYSYDKEISIKNLFNNMDYMGGFAMEGARVLGSGTHKRDAKIVVKKGEEDFMEIRAPAFVIHPDRINASTASISIYHETDSIYHPGLEMKYLDGTKELTFTRDESMKSITPWFDSWHKIEIYCEQLNWILNQPKLNFEMMKGPNKESKAIFESTNYYSRNRYDRLQGIDEINILNVIKNFADKKKSREIELEELTRYMSKPQEQVEVQLLNLANRGFLVYDYEDKVARVKDKLYNYVKARDGKTDYDEIFFNSNVTNASNAILDLNNFDLKIQGVKSVFISDSQHVAIYPKGEELLVKKDMDVFFHGKIEAGLFDFYGRNCSFEYNKFRLNLPSVDSMVFYVQSKTWDPKAGRFPLVKVKTSIRNLSGDLEIDQPDNKAGLKSIKEYPIFHNKNSAQVFWDKKYIQKGVYTKDKFFFDVDPFTIQSLDVVHTDSLNFGGGLTSAGIFPKIIQPLRVRPDYSLGFEKYTEIEGLPVYGGKGTFVSKIDLSELGLRGDGTLLFLNSTSHSGSFLFLPDSLRAFSRSFSMTEQLAAVEYPAVTADSVNQFWMPYKDSMVVSSVRKEMHMYNDQSTFGGMLALTPAQLSGNGTVKIKDAEMDSKGFRFKRRTFDALIANFRIKSYDLSDLTISTKNYQTHFDFDKRRGEFRSNVGISKVEFPLNKYVCSMDRFDWMIDNEEISLANEQSRKAIPDSLSLAQLIDVGYTGSEFISVHPLQDSLKFFAARARYNLRTNVINAEDVRIIKVADAAVFPDSGSVRIFRDAQMQTLTHAIIIANTKSKYHQFYQSEVSIASRKRYTGRGTLDYVDRNGYREKISFSGIRVDSSGQTIANGIVPDSAYFKLSPEFQFRGDVTVDAARKELNFDGGFKAVSDCFHKIKPEWIKFNANINPYKIMIPLEPQPTNMLSEKMALTLAFSPSEASIYPAFFIRRSSFSDSSMVIASGMMTYNVPATEFRIADTAKLRDLSLPGNFISLNQTLCRMRGDGKLMLGVNGGPLALEAYGTMDHYLLNDSTHAHIALAMDFPFSDDAMQNLSTQLGSMNLNGLTIDKTPFNAALQFILEPKELERFKNELSLTGRLRKFPEQLERTMFFGDVNLHWDSTSKSWLSSGPIGIATIGKNQVYRYVNGMMEFTKKRNGDEFTFYLQLTGQDWYFFNYRNNVLQALSSDLSFNDKIISARKSKTEQKKADKQAKGFSYTISTDRKKRDFLRKFEKTDE
ncbi:MAG: hypothetical protein NTY96_02315 [Bacteroidetes bacterium]|nr:hypothetical protein [Bacteroidota bacterium]